MCIDFIRMGSRIAVLPVYLLFATFVQSAVGFQTENESTTYRLPPQSVVDIIDATPEPAVDISPDGKWMLFVERDAMPGIEDVARRMLQLGGIRIDPVANSQFQTSYDTGLALRKRDGGNLIEIPLPKDAKLAGTSWSHNSANFVFVVVAPNGSQLWACSVNDPQNPRQLTDRLSTVMGGVRWMPDAKRILCHLVPDNRADEPTAPAIPAGPNIQESTGKKSPTRTYQDLLTNAHDESLFDHYATAQLAIIELDGNLQKINQPGIYSSVAPSPDGEHLLVTRIQRPYSYLMTYRSFPQKIEVWNNNGEFEHLVADVPLAENIPIEGVRTGPRNVGWRAGKPATIVWAEALDGGDPNREADFRDRMMTVSSPFKTEPAEIIKVEHRAFGLSYMANPDLVVTTEYDRDRRWVRSMLHNLASDTESPKILMDRSIRDRYADPGRIVTVPDKSGFPIALQHENWIYRSGTGASPKGNLPFFDRQDISNLKSERLWRSKEGVYERVVSVMDAGDEATPPFITVRETPESPPNYFLRDLKKELTTALTDFRDPTPQIRGIKKQLVKYERADGVPLSATLYLPADYREGQRLPLIVWAYPREFNDVRTAGQIGASPSRFTQIRGISHLALLTQGYAIMDGATMPVIGDPETMNDTFVEQIVGAAQAAIDKAVEMGVADRNRVGVGGHSYGAFMTANLLAHCDLFNAGVARSGAYNRTLTPFGFQSERRPLWEAKDVYFGISPFMHAHKIQEPILLVHGENDNNSGTFPMQSRRMYQAIKGNGGTVRLVMLPHESHGYRARESVLHTQAEMIDWFDTYVKNAADSSGG